MWNQRQAVEIFHLHFLRALGLRVDKQLIALKGGCNLRFFFKSIRYSEDMDLDAHTISVGTLRSNVSRILEAPTFRNGLQVHQLEIVRVSAPKQTETTQRWKITLKQSRAGNELPTKIVFSRRDVIDTTLVEPVDPLVIQSYRLYPVLMRHYTLQAAFSQKIAALALREQIQSRDVFDLKLLLDAGAAQQPLNALTKGHVEAAILNAMAIDYDAFAAQVLAFIEPDYQQFYGQRSAWATLQAQVVASLERLQS